MGAEFSSDNDKSPDAIAEVQLRFEHGAWLQVPVTDYSRWAHAAALLCHLALYSTVESLSNDDFAALFTCTCTACRIIYTNGTRGVQRGTTERGRRGVLRGGLGDVIDASVERRVDLQTDDRTFSDAPAGDRNCGLWRLTRRCQDENNALHHRAGSLP
jgi:hypothetical protein